MNVFLVEDPSALAAVRRLEVIVAALGGIAGVILIGFLLGILIFCCCPCSCCFLCFCCRKYRRERDIEMVDATTLTTVVVSRLIDENK